MISVCLATYNGERFVGAQIESILSQLGENDELIISDDHSTDTTRDILKSYTDKRIRLLDNPGKGINSNFENALRHTRGDFIFLSDQDDVWLPGKVEECVKALENADCVVHDSYITDENLDIIDESFFSLRKCRRGALHNWIRNGYLGCAMAFRKEVLALALPIPDKIMVWQDIWIGLLSDIRFRLVFIPFKGIKFRRHSSTSSVTAKRKFSIGRMIAYRINAAYFVTKRIILRK